MGILGEAGLSHTSSRLLLLLLLLLVLGRRHCRRVLLLHLLHHLLRRNVVVHSLPRAGVRGGRLVVTLRRVVLEARGTEGLALLLLLLLLLRLLHLLLRLRLLRLLLLRHVVPGSLLALVALGVCCPTLGPHILPLLLLRGAHLHGHLRGRRLDRRRLLMLLSEHLSLLLLGVHVHLLHHGGVHASHLRHALHGLLHHGGVDDGHGPASAAPELCHGLDIPLHLLVVLGHHLRRHPVVGGALCSLRAVLSLRPVGVSVVSSVPVIESVPSAIAVTEVVAVVTVVHMRVHALAGIATRLRFLDLDLGGGTSAKHVDVHPGGLLLPACP